MTTEDGALLEDLKARLADFERHAAEAAQAGDLATSGWNARLAQAARDQIRDAEAGRVPERPLRSCANIAPAAQRGGGGDDRTLTMPRTTKDRFQTAIHEAGHTAPCSITAGSSRR